MKILISLLFSTLCWVLFSGSASAKIFNCPGIAFNENEIYVTSGAHAAGEVISRPKTAATCRVGRAALWYNYQIINNQVSANSGKKYNDGVNDYIIWKTGIPGIGYVLSAYYESGEVIGGYQKGYLPFNTTKYETSVRSSFPAIISWANARPTVTLVTTGEDVILPGKYNAALSVATYHASYSSSSEGNQASFDLRLRIGVEAQTCTASSSTYVVNMGTIPSTRFTGPGSEVAGSPLDITINCTESNVGITGTFSDFSDLSNTTNLLNLTPASTAQGVKIQLINDGTPVTYAPPGDAGYGTSGVVIKLPAKELSSIFSITPKYVQTGSKVKGGTANAVAVISFSYD